MRTAIKVALLIVPTLAVAQERVLPNDVLIGGLDAVLAIRQASPTTYEFSQLAPMAGTPPGSAPALCTGAALAHMKGYPGLSVGAVDDGTPSSAKRTLTVALLKAPGDVALLPASLRWLPYSDIRTLRERCAQFIQPKYLWPAS
jgi:hypothetical protein